MHTIRDSLNTARLEPPLELGSGAFDAIASVWKAISDLAKDVRGMQKEADEAYPWLRGW